MTDNQLFYLLLLQGDKPCTVEARNSFSGKKVIEQFTRGWAATGERKSKEFEGWVWSRGCVGIPGWSSCNELGVVGGAQSKGSDWLRSFVTQQSVRVAWVRWEGAVCFLQCDAHRDAQKQECDFQVDGKGGGYSQKERKSPSAMLLTRIRMKNCKIALALILLIHSGTWGK